MIRSSLWFTRLRTSVSSAERLSHIGGDQLGIAFVAIWPLCKCLRAQKTWNLIFPFGRIRAKHVEVATPSSSRRSTAFVQPSFCIGCATQKLLIRSLVRLEKDRSSEPIYRQIDQRAQRKSNPCRRQPPPAAQSHAQAIPK